MSERDPFGPDVIAAWRARRAPKRLAVVLDTALEARGRPRTRRLVPALALVALLALAAALVLRAPAPATHAPRIAVSIPDLPLRPLTLALGPRPDLPTLAAVPPLPRRPSALPERPRRHPPAPATDPLTTTGE